MFPESPRLEIYCSSVNDILLDTIEQEKMKLFFSRREYHMAVRLWLVLFRKRDLIKPNVEAFMKLLKDCEKIGMIRSRSKKNYERHFVAREEVLIAGEPLELRFSRKNYLRFVHSASRLELETATTYDTIRAYMKVFRELGFHKSRKFLISFERFIKRINRKISKPERERIRKSLRTFGLEKIKKKVEYDHFPPDFIYRFAKDKHIRELPIRKRPIWPINRGAHRDSISTGSSKESREFMNLQRDLFSKGMYYETLRNYILRYINDGTIKPTNKDTFFTTLRCCAGVNLIDSEQLRILIDTIENYYTHQ